MYIYSLRSSYDCEIDNFVDVAHDYDYILHEKEFTKEEFENMCKESFNNKYNEKSISIIKKHLVDNYGFKKLEPVHRFDFEEEYRN